MSLLSAMFINKQAEVMQNLDAYRRFNIIKLKNSEAYDQYIGGVTLTFFPISILMLPFMIPIILFRSSRISDFALKIQYAFMMTLYFCLAIIVLIPVIPLLYAKIIINSIYIAGINKREDFKG